MVILDLYFGEADHEGFCPLGGRRFNFYDLGIEIVRCLKANGVVIALLGSVAVTERSLQSQEYMRHTLELKQERLRDKPKPPPVKENSYDWLDQGFLDVTNVNRLHSNRTDGIAWRLPQGRFTEYLATAKAYWVSIEGMDPFERGGRPIVTHSISEGQRWGTSRSVGQYDVRVIATGKHTGLPVAAAMDYLHLGGLLVLMPPVILDEADAVRKAHVAQDLKSIGEYLKEQIEVETPKEHAEWVWEHRALPAKTLSEQIEAAESKVKELSQQQAKYDNMLVLLDGTGKPLEETVLKLFGPEWLGFVATPTPEGAGLDVFVNDPATNHTLAVEVTGIGGKFTKNDKHLSDVLQYLPEHVEKNQSGRTERIVLAVNTFKDLPTSSRDHGADFTPPTQTIARDNHFLLVRTYDLFQLWIDFVEKRRTAAQIFDLLFGSEGVFEYQPVAQQQG